MRTVTRKYKVFRFGELKSKTTFTDKKCSLFRM